MKVSSSVSYTSEKYKRLGLERWRSVGETFSVPAKGPEFGSRLKSDPGGVSLNSWSWLVGVGVEVG